MKIHLAMYNLKRCYQVLTEDGELLGCVVFSAVHLPFRPTVEITEWFIGPRGKH